ncbi:MAG: hypothetical protein PHH16_03050 [Candidatus Gracilibacteria bacterium]|nr:hypothetical protein [Candidatus Gracilibacteria bacterium]
MGLDGLDNLEGDEGGSEGGAEQQSEASKAKAAKSLAGIKRTQKDEGKAKRDNDYLHECLREIIVSEKYDVLIPYIFPLFEAGIPSHIIIGAFSLVHQRASDIIRDHYISDTNSLALTNPSSSDKKYPHRTFAVTPFASPVEFDDQTIDPAIRKRINEWVEDIFTVVSFDPSVIMTERFLYILGSKEKNDVVKLLSGVLIFFLLRVNVHISGDKASLYTEFILKEVEKKLKELKLEGI